MDWKRKLTSRKFWLAVAGFITSILVAFNVGDNVVAQVSAIISGFGSVIAYICAEAYADGKNIEVNDDETVDD